MSILSMQCASDNDNESVIIVLAMWVMLFLQSLVSKSMGVLLPILLDKFPNYTRNVGVVVSLQLFSGNLLALSGQRLTKIIKTRKVIVFCGILTSTGLFLCSMASNFHILVLGMFLTGSAVMGSTIAVGKIPYYFNTHNKEVTYIATSAMPIGIMISAPLTQVLIDTYGWRAAMVLISVGSLNYVAAGAVLKSMKQMHNDFNHVHGKTVKSIQNEKDDNGSCTTTPTVSFFKDGYFFIIVLLISMVAGYIYNGWVVYLVSIAQKKGMSPFEAANIATFGGVGCFLIRIILAVTQRHTTSFRCAFLMGSLLVMISYGGMVFANSFWFLSLLSFALGIAYGILGSQMFNAAVATVEKQDAVIAISFANLSFSSGYLASGYISGWLYDIYGTFTPTLIAQCAVSSLITVAIGAEYMVTFLKSLKENKAV